MSSASSEGGESQFSDWLCDDVSDQTVKLTPAETFPPTSPVPNSSGSASISYHRFDGYYTEGMELDGRRRYRLGRQLGSGGMGSVFLADTLKESTEDSFPDQVAIKFFNVDLGVDPEQLLKRELSALLALRHERIPAVLDWRVTPPDVFAVFPYCAGGSLAAQIKQNGQLSVDQLWRLLADLLAALVAAHRGCILHLDIKPANVLLDAEGNYLLADFGISQGSLVSRAIVSTGLGAPVFQSPEQRRFEHEEFDARTDLWGVGITVWCAATGITSLKLRDLIQEHSTLGAGLPTLRSQRPECPPELDEIIMSLLASRRDDRPGSAAEVLTRVRQHLHQGTRSETSSHVPLPLNTSQDPLRFAVYEQIMDPLWANICRSGAYDSYLVRYPDGAMLCEEGEESYHAFVLLQGTIRVERNGQLLGLENREGTFLGEVTTLTGATRTASLVAKGEVWVFMYNAAQFEHFVTQNPAVAIRLIKILAERLQNEYRLRR